MPGGAGRPGGTESPGGAERPGGADNPGGIDGPGGAPREVISTDLIGIGGGFAEDELAESGLFGTEVASSGRLDPTSESAVEGTGELEDWGGRMGSFCFDSFVSASARLDSAVAAGVEGRDCDDDATLRSKVDFV